MLKIKIPATTANMGPGFDCIGMALSLYNYVEIQEGTENGEPFVIRVKPQNPGHSTLDWYTEPVMGVARDGTNLIYQTISHFYHLIDRPVPPLTITQEDYIPMTRGLGSSAACVTAGLLAGNCLNGEPFTREEIITLAAKLEGHPDNTTPALAGGLTVGALSDNDLVYSKLTGRWEDTLKFALFIPAFTLSTETARAVLPAHYSRKDAVFNVSRAALLVSALITGDYAKLTTAMKDCMHEPYRKDLVPGMVDLMRTAKQNGAYSIFLSGAGPALMAVTEDEAFIERMRRYIQQMPNRWDVGWIKPDTTGAVIAYID